MTNLGARMGQDTRDRTSPAAASRRLKYAKVSDGLEFFIGAKAFLLSLQELTELRQSQNKQVQELNVATFILSLVGSINSTTFTSFPAGLTARFGDSRVKRRLFPPGHGPRLERGV